MWIARDRFSQPNLAKLENHQNSEKQNRGAIMASLFQKREFLLADGKITPQEVETIKNHITEDGQLDFEDVKFLVDLLSDANEVCPEFDELFFPVVRQVLLEDGKISMDEQFLLLKMLYSDGNVRESERKFLQDLCREAESISPDFKQLCENAMSCASENWDLGC